MVPLVDTPSFQVTASPDGGNPLAQSLKQQYGCVVIEKVAPMGIEDVAPSAAFQDTMIAQEEPAHFEAVPSRGFSTKQLQLIFYMRRDIVDKLFRHEVLNRRLDALFDSLSNESISRRCPTCCQPFIVTPAWHQPPPGDGSKNTSGV